jgi:hypothetical protein
MKQTIELHETDAKPSSSPLGNLNQLFHKEHQNWQARAEKEIARGDIPIVMRLDDRLILTQGEQQDIYQINGDRHHELKALSHLPLIAYLTLADTESDVKDISYLSGQLDKTRTIIEALGSYIEPIQTAIDQLNDSLIKNQGIMTYEAATEFARFLKPTFQKLIYDAANDEVKQLISAMSYIKSKVGDEQRWSKTFFVICGGHQPRYKQLTKLFFERWLREETNSNTEALHRVIYAEGCQSFDDSLKLVTSRIVSEKLGDLFLHSPLSLDEDVLGDAATAVIDRLFRKANQF